MSSVFSMFSMFSFSSFVSPWWLALSLLALPVWWHRERRQRVRELPLATARFLPLSSPQQLRVWRWRERVLLLLRCLLLAGVIAWLADLVLPWRGDTVLVAPGTDSAWAQRQVKQAGFSDAGGVALPPGDAFAWLALHEREWRRDSRLLILGEVPMPALLPRSRHQVELRAPAPSSTPALNGALRVRLASASGERAARWKALFGALDGPRRYVVDEFADSAANNAANNSVAADASPAPELIIWDRPEAPPASLRAPLWWIADAAAFPELANAPMVDGMRYADSARGRLWHAAAWPPVDAGAARKLFEAWQRLHYAPQPYAMVSQSLAPSAGAPQGRANGALHYTLTLVLIALFALERMMAHARRR